MTVQGALGLHNGWSSMYVAMLTHPKYACGRVYTHYAVPIGIDPALAASRLLERLHIPSPKAIPV